MSLVLGAGSKKRALQDELAAALTDVFPLPAVDALLDLVHAFDGELFATNLSAVQSVHGLAAREERSLKSEKNETLRLNKNTYHRWVNRFVIKLFKSDFFCWQM